MTDISKNRSSKELCGDFGFDNVYAVFLGPTMAITTLQKRNWFIVILVSLATVHFSCSRTEEKLSPEAQMIRYLTGAGNRYWRIKEQYVNGTKQALTPPQLAYNKTYTVSIGANAQENIGTWRDSDGYQGSWKMIDIKHVEEVVLNAPVNPPPIQLTVNSIGTFDMDVVYTANGQTVRTVYFAY